MRSKFDEQLRLLNQEMMYMGTKHGTGRESKNCR